LEPPTVDRKFSLKNSVEGGVAARCGKRLKEMSRDIGAGPTEQNTAATARETGQRQRDA